MVHVLEDSSKVVSKIFHIADIHIRLFKRREEYLEVFKNLYEEIRKKADDESIIVIAGDLVNSKVEMSPEMISMTSGLLRELSNIAPTIVIPGNHDCSLNNPQRLDAISPIVDNLQHDRSFYKNIFYLKKTGLYRFGNILFSNMSILDTNENYIKASDISAEYNSLTKIALYHGVINNAILDTGYIMKDDNMSIDFFDGYDIVLLGDIHKKQTMQTYQENPKKPTIAYCGSIIQQNHGESLSNHGMLVWDVKNRAFEFCEIENSHGFVTFDINNGKIISDEQNVPAKPRMRLKVTETTATELKELLVYIRKKYSPDEVSINRTHSAIQDLHEINKIDVSKIRDVQFQNSLIEDYLKTNFNANADELKKVFEINKRLNSILPVEDVTRNILWKPKLFQFSNMFSYGEDNVVDFSKMNGIVGLFSTNASGKSAMLNALSFCLFDKCSTAFKANNVLNNRKKSFKCELNFEINGEDYFIKKVATKSAKTEKVSVKIDFWKSTADGEIVDLNGDKRQDTRSIIQSYIGSYEDFALTCMCTQNDPANFIDLGQSERKDLLGKFMDIIIFDKLYEIGTEESKELSTAIKQFEKRNFDEEIANIESSLEMYAKELTLLQSNQKKLVDDRKNLNDDVVGLARKLVDIDKSIVDINSLESNKKEKEERIKKLTGVVNDITDEISKKVSEYELLKSNVISFADRDMDTEYNELIGFESEREILQSKIDELKIHVDHKLEKIEKLGKLEYDPNCKYCMNNIFVKDAISTKQSLSEDKQLASRLLEHRTELDIKVKEKEFIRDEWKKIESDKNKMQQLQMYIVAADAKRTSQKSKIISLQSELEKTIRNIELYYKSKEDIENNKKLEEQISELKIKIASISREIESIENKLVNCNSQILFNKNQKNAILEEIKKAKDIEDEYYSYQYYLEAIKRDSIPYDLITKAIPAIESEANNILNQIVDFSIMLDVDNKNIACRLVYDESRYWPLELASGMETFITGLAIRVALINISNLPRPNFLAIDEGFSALDSENAANLPMIFDYLKSQFDFTVVISHLDYMRDFVDITLDLKKEDDFSKIIYT